jgi:hypothetical protein
MDARNSMAALAVSNSRGRKQQHLHKQQQGRQKQLKDVRNRREARNSSGRKQQQLHKQQQGRQKQEGRQQQQECKQQQAEVTVGKFLHTVMKVKNSIFLSLFRCR